MQNDLLNATGKRNAALDAAPEGFALGLSLRTSDFNLVLAEFNRLYREGLATDA